MDGPQGRAYYPGVQAVLSAEVDVTHGITPSVATVAMVPQVGFVPENGNFVLSYDKQTLIWYDCKILHVGFSRTDSGEYWRLQIADRRWKWSFGCIWGRYNIHKENGEIEGYGTDNSSEKTPQELASLCLASLGEGSYDVSDLPNDSRPEVEWDFIPPAEALAALCDQLGCRVVLGLDNRVRIYRAGYGRTLNVNQPNVLENCTTGDPPELPDTLAIVTGRCCYQDDFLLEAVGEDTDGRVKPIGELSYAPSGGWENYQGMPVPEFPHITDKGWSESQTQRARELAQMSVFKWYRIKVPFTLGALAVQVADRDDILPVETEQVETQLKSGSSAEKENKPACVYGSYAKEEDDESNNTNAIRQYMEADDTVKYNGGFSIETDTGIVKFSRAVYRNANTSGFQISPAVLYLRTAGGYKQPGTRVFMRYIRWRGTGGAAGTPARCVMHDEIVRKLYKQSNGKVVDNVKDVNEECDYYLDALMKEYQFRTPQVVRYAGLELIEPDGSIEQLSFSVTPQGTITTAARNTEIVTAVVPYKQRRAMEKQRLFSRVSEYLVKQTMKWIGVHG